MSFLFHCLEQRVSDRVILFLPFIMPTDLSSSSAARRRSSSRLQQTYPYIAAQQRIPTGPEPILHDIPTPQEQARLISDALNTIPKAGQVQYLVAYKWWTMLMKYLNLPTQVYTSSNKQICVQSEICMYIYMFVCYYVASSF